MIQSNHRLRVYAFGAPCDMRKSFFTLSGLVMQMGHTVVDGDVFLFVSRNRKLAKTLWHDGSGLCLLSKRLDRGCFAPVWERAEAGGSLELTTSELGLFLEGSELIARQALSPTRQPVVEHTFSDVDFR